jgi:uncharacterized protein (TIGR02246 family)
VWRLSSLQFTARLRFSVQEEASSVKFSIRGAAIVGGVYLLLAGSSLAQDGGSAAARARPGGASPGSAEGIAEIRASSEAFAAAFNRRDAKSIAALWTEDGDCIDDTGKQYQGRAEIEKVYEQLFRQLSNGKIKVVIDSVRLLSADAAIEDGSTVLEPPPPGPPAINKYTAVHVKQNGQWLISSVRETRLEMPSGYAKVADLEWLIGTWTAEEHGEKTISRCTWVANKSFVQRTYTTTHNDRSTSSGVQIIGFNSETNRIQSWNFSPDGGLAIGIWSPRTGGWSAEIRGVTSRGTVATAVNVLTRLDDNAYTWQSIKRVANGTPLPDTDEVVFRRNARQR